MVEEKASMSMTEKEAAADKARKAKVDAANRKREEKVKAEQKELADTPLTAEEKAFIATIQPMMNQGRAIMQPSSSDIVRYGQLLKREKVKG